MLALLATNNSAELSPTKWPTANNNLVFKVWAMSLAIPTHGLLSSRGVLPKVPGCDNQVTSTG